MAQFKYFCILDGLTFTQSEEIIGSDQAEIISISAIILNLEQKKVKIIK